MEKLARGCSNESDYSSAAAPGLLGGGGGRDSRPAERPLRPATKVQPAGFQGHGATYQLLKCRSDGPTSRLQ